MSPGMTVSSKECSHSFPGGLKDNLSLPMSALVSEHHSLVPSGHPSSEPVKGDGQRGKGRVITKEDDGAEGRQLLWEWGLPAAVWMLDGPQRSVYSRLGPQNGSMGKGSGTSGRWDFGGNS